MIRLNDKLKSDGARRGRPTSRIGSHLSFRTYHLAFITMGLFDKLKRQVFARPPGCSTPTFRDLFKSSGRSVDDQFLEQLYAILIKTDVGVPAGRQTVERIRTKFRGRVVEMPEVLADVKQELKTLLAQSDDPLRLADRGPTVIIVAGVNGAGKTTSIAKLTRLFTSQGKRSCSARPTPFGPRPSNS